MQDDDNIPVLTDLIEEGIEIDLSELGLDEDPPIDVNQLSELSQGNTALEQEIRRILDEHMELAWQEIRIAIAQADSESSSE